MDEAILSGNRYTVSAGWMGSLSLALDGVVLQRESRVMLHKKTERITLTDFQHAGIVWFENPGPRRVSGQIRARPRYFALMYLWRDTKTSEQITGFLDSADDSFQHLQQRRVDAVASTPAGKFATKLDAVIADARTTPPPPHLPGSYLPGNGRAVWIPSLGASNPF